MARRYSSLAEFLKRTDTRQVDFAKQLGISQPQLSKIVNGKQRVRLELALKIARLADIPVGSLHTESAA